MKLFKSIDTKLEEIGFIKIDENKYGARYERYNEDYKYTHCVDILHKKSGNYIVQSYDRHLADINGIGNICVGLTGKEMRLFYKKMKQLKLVTF